MNSEVIGAMRRLFAEIDAAVPHDQESQAERARRLFDLLGRYGGTVEALEKPAFQRTRIEELRTWGNDPWEGRTFDVGANTTRPLEYNNGLVVDVARAKTSVAGETDHVALSDQDASLRLRITTTTTVGSMEDSWTVNTSRRS